MFESLWIDMDGADATIAEMRSCAVTASFGDLFQHYKDLGYCIIPNAVPHHVIDAYLSELQTAIRNDLLKASLGHEIVNARDMDMRTPLSKVLDSHVYCPAARKAAFSPPIKLFLDLLFGETPLAFQSLYFEVGSTQAIHNDTAYVVVEGHPKSLCAAWIALEDIVQGTGELTYYPGSHRFGDFLYPDNRKYWDADHDGHAIHDHHLFWIHEEAKRRGVEPASFLPKKGDMLFWHADLCHGGGKIIDPSQTRRSLVVHYCPMSCTPHYFNFLPEARQIKRATNGGYVSSSFFDVTKMA